jgi:sulfonate transport system substrate-binding protein
MTALAPIHSKSRFIRSKAKHDPFMSSHTMRRRHLLAGLLTALVLVPSGASADGVKQIGIGYSSIVPTSLILKEKGWLEQELGARGVAVKWVVSLGSNKTIEFLRAKSIDFGPSSSASAFLARANGTPTKLIYWTERKNGAPILVRDGSPYKSISDLKGKKIAATPGTGPYIGLIAALAKHGLTKDDVQIVALQHPEGRLALAAGRVDAWAGLEPDWSIAEIRNKAHVLFADETLPGGGVFNVREEFARNNPDLVAVVLHGLERARRYAAEHPDEAIRLFSDASKLDFDVARSAFYRSDAGQPQVVASDAEGLVVWGELFKSIGAIPADTDVMKVARETLDPSFSAALGKSVGGN